MKGKKSKINTALIFDKEAKPKLYRKHSLFNKSCWITLITIGKKKKTWTTNFDSYLTSYTKFNLKCSIELNAKLKIILEEIIESFHDLGWVIGFLEPKHNTQKKIN